MTLAQSVTTHNREAKLKGLYAITDSRLIPDGHFSETVESALLGGASIIQYRDKSGDHKKQLRQAHIVRSLCLHYHALSIINDDIALAKAVAADGVHIGKNDGSLLKARQQLGENAIIGVSCYNNISLAIEAEKNSADYVAFGAMFSSPTKPEAIVAGPDIITRAKQQLSIPVCTIGGIDESNIQQLILRGADMTAVISSLFSTEDIQQTAKKLSKNFS